MESLGIFAKFPQPGKVKSRLGAEIGNRESSELYACFIRDLTRRFRNSADQRTLCITPDTEESMKWFDQISEGDYNLWVQPESDLGTRMISFIRDEFRHESTKVVVIGTDSPTLPIDLVHEAFSKLEKSDAVLGPAEDGGFYLIGFSRFHPMDFSQIPWSSSNVLKETLDLLHRENLSAELLKPWYDVDTLSDLKHLYQQLEISQENSGISVLKWTRDQLEHLLPDIQKAENFDK